jgi:hypothetical protein
MTIRPAVIADHPTAETTAFDAVRKRRPMLRHDQQCLVVRLNAAKCRPSEVARILNEQFGVDVSPKNIGRYDPTKAAGATMKPEFVRLFEDTRRAYLEQIDAQGEMVIADLVITRKLP